MDAPPLSAEFLRARGESGVDPSLDRLLTNAIEQARARWPALRVEPAGFARFLGEKTKGRGAGEALGTLQLDDLYLAFACAEQDPEAVASLSRLIDQDLGVVLAQRPALRSSAEDLRQSALERLLLPGREGRARIADYAGTGSLRSWLRVALTRLALNAATRGPREKAEPDDALLRLAGAAGDLELDALQHQHGPKVQEAIAAALAELEPRERALLKQRYMQQSTVDEIAVMYGVHRVTASRQLERARERLEARVQERLLESLGISEGELHSVVRGLRSQLDLHLSSMFRSRK